jgi:tetratricopeptide (TPR) repeat protein
MGARVSHTLATPIAPAENSVTATQFAAEQPRRWQTPVIAALLGVFTLLLYAPTLRNGFVSLDDPVYVIDNPRINQGLVWRNVRMVFNTIVTGEWHPLTLISHMADVQLFGLNPAGHHFMNSLWHAFNVVMLFLLLKAATRSVERSAAVAALFAAFPLNVEAVAWIAERKSLLCTAFLLLAIGAYGWYVRRPGIARYLLVMLFFALGLMSKAMIITLPCALLLLDYWPLNRFDLPAFDLPTRGAATAAHWSRGLWLLVAEKVPLLMLSALSSMITTRAMRKYGAVVSADFYPPVWRAKNTLYSYLLYILKGLWPSHLAIFYPYDAATMPIWKPVLGAVALVTITALVWRYRQKKYLVTGWFWYVGTMVPVIGIVQVGHQALADRYAYIPFLGLFVMAVWGLAEVAGRLDVSQITRVAVVCAIVGGYALTSYAQMGYWHDTYTLWLHATQVTSKNAFGEENLAQMLIEKGRPDLAEQHFDLATTYLPRWSVAHFDFAEMLRKEQRYQDAIREYRLALAYETEPDEAAASHINLGAIYIQQKQLAAAISEFDAAISIAPKNWLPFTNRGLVEYAQGNLDAAIGDFSHAVAIEATPKDYFWLGRSLEDKGQFGQAATAYENALRLEPNLSDAKAGLARIRAKAH